MGWIENKTRFKHKTYGEGIFIGFKDKNLLIDFDAFGSKTISYMAIAHGILEEIETSEQETDHSIDYINVNNMTTLQFDTSPLVLNGTNILEGKSFQTPITFNESYIVIGDLEAPKIYGCYNLIIMGNLRSDIIEIQGGLTVLGTINAEKIQCEKQIICTKGISAKQIFAGNDIIAYSAKSEEIKCNGNISFQTVAEVEKKILVDGMLVANEGIIGVGELKSLHVVTGEYFEFEGSVDGTIIDLGEDNLEDKHNIDIEKLSLKNRMECFQQGVVKELELASKEDEVFLKDLVMNLSKFDSKNMSEWGEILNKIIELSYEDEITNLRDYLILIYADYILPDAIKKYESIEHVFTRMLPKASKESDKLVYSAKNIKEFEYSLKIINVCGDESCSDKEKLLDLIFQSIGIKYNTVKQFLKS